MVAEQIDSQVVAIDQPSNERPILLPIALELAGLFYRDSREEQGKVRYQFLTPDGVDLLLMFNVPLADLSFMEANPRPGVDPRKLRARQSVRLENIPVVTSGRHFFVTHLSQDGGGSWAEVARVPLEINLSLKVDPDGKP